MIKWAMAYVQGTLERDNPDVDHGLVQCVAVLMNRLEKVEEASSITGA